MLTTRVTHCFLVASCLVLFDLHRFILSLIVLRKKSFIVGGWLLGRVGSELSGGLVNLGKRLKYFGLPSLDVLILLIFGAHVQEQSQILRTMGTNLHKC